MTQALSPSDMAKYACAVKAAERVQTGMTVGLGTGSTAAFLVARLGERLREEGLRFRAVPTSTRTAEQARAEGIEVITLEEAGRLDLTIDGADEFDPQMTLIKGGGGAHLQEKIVATASDKMVVIAGVDKDVAQLGAFPLPVEVIPFGWTATRDLVARVLETADVGGREITRRMAGDEAFRTDEGNFVLDLHLKTIGDARALSVALNQIAGVVENGLFLDICSEVIIGHTDGRVVTRDLASGAETEDQIAAPQG